MIRTAAILCLVGAGFLILNLAYHDPRTAAIGCWTLAVVYALVTSPRRFL